MIEKTIQSLKKNPVSKEKRTNMSKKEENEIGFCFFEHHQIGMIEELNRTIIYLRRALDEALKRKEQYIMTKKKWHKKSGKWGKLDEDFGKYPVS